MNRSLHPLDCLRDGVLVLPEGRIADANRAMTEMPGFASADELVATELKKWLHPDAGRLLADLLAAVDLHGVRAG